MKYILLTCLIFVTAYDVPAGVIKGTVYNTNNEPIPFVTIRVVGSGQSISANENGRYRLYLSEGSYKLKFSHISHYSEIIEITVIDSVIEQKVNLRPALIEISPIKVFERRYDPAQKIILEAIARKDEILSKIKEYSFKAYTKLVVRDTGKVDSADIVLITETRLDAFWKYPDKYKEIITARKQTSNIKAEENLVTIGEILNFNKNRLELGRYAVVSPTAKDALKYYNYYLLDTIYIDNHAVFILEIEPKSQTTPLFEGTIKIADSSFAVVGVDVGFNEGFDGFFFVNPRYSQVYSEFENEYWMPTLIQFSSLINYKLPGIPTYSVDYIAALHKFIFDSSLYDVEFNEYALEIDDHADNVDSVKWNEGQIMPLTEEENYGYNRIDSIENAPQPVTKRILGLTLKMLYLSIYAKDIFHFNRVEGAYFGYRRTFNRIFDRMTLRLKSGYAFDGDFWQHNYSFNYLISKKQKISIETEYHDEIRTRFTVFSRTNGNATLMAIVNKTDPYDYYLEKGFTIKAHSKLFNYTGLQISYHDVNQYAASNSTEYSFFRQSKQHRLNAAIVEGKLRSISANFRYDSRKLIKEKKLERKIYSLPFTLFSANLEIASDRLIENDFNFRRYYFWFYRRQRLFNYGIGAIYIFAGVSEKTLPPQKYFTIDFGSRAFENILSFHTLGEYNFSGSRILSVYTSYDFGRKLFQKSGLPLIKDMPFTLMIHGGVFWSDFNDNPYQPGDEFINIAPNSYSEIGFGLGQMLPFNIITNFTWQLSNHTTNGFSISISGNF